MPEGSIQSFGAVLRQFRLRAGLSQEELGARARLSAETIGALERGVRRAPYRTTVELLAQALSLSQSELESFEVAAARARGRPRALSARATLPNGNLPFSLTSFIGRQDELRDLRDLLRQHRLVTITGTGGVGKTRTALELAAAVADSFPDGTWLVDLAVLDAAASIEARITAALGLHIPDAGDRTALVRELRTKSVLLVIDNCEHIIESVASTLAGLLRDCAGLKILATSRERLALTGEAVFRIQTLPVPPDYEPLSAGTARAYSAIELFADRARLAHHAYTLRDDDLPFIVRICRRLDGLPLAIEIAAARSPFGIRALESTIGVNPTLVSSGLRDAPPRHQTLAATIAWSYGLLGEGERGVLRELSVFSGSFTLEAARAVCSSDRLGNVDLPFVLSALRDKSLLNSDDEQADPRFRLLQSIREYTYQELVAHGEAKIATARHDEYFATIADSLREKRRVLTHDQAFAHVHREIDNIDAALRRGLAIDGDPIIAARITGGLLSYWQHTGRIRESMRNATSLIGRIDSAARPTLAAALYLVREYGLAGLERVEPNLRAVDLLIGGRDGDRLSEAFVSLAHAYYECNQLAKARTALGWAWTFATKAQLPPHRFADILFHRATTDQYEGKFEAARANFITALEMITAEHTSLAAMIRSGLAELEFRLGNFEQALALAEGVAAAMQSTGHELPYLCNVCAAQIALGDIVAAKVSARKIVGLAEGHHPAVQIVALEHVATIAALERRPALAARLRGYAEELARRIGFERGPNEAYCYAIGTAELSKHAREDEQRAWMAEGARLPEKSALEIALTV